MGCYNSVPDPNLTYEKQINNNNNKNKIHPHKPGLIQNGNCNSQHNRQPIKGDLFTYNFVKLSREKTVHQKMELREKRAQEISARILDENERFSLSTTRSAATSKAVSPRNEAQVGLSGFSSANTTQNSQPENDLTSTEPIKDADLGSDLINHLSDQGSRDSHTANVQEAGNDVAQDGGRKSTNGSSELQSHDKRSSGQLTPVGNDAAISQSTDEKEKKKSKHKFRKKKDKHSSGSNGTVRNDMIAHG